MDDFHDDDAYHDDKNNGTSSPGGSSETGSQLAVSARPERVPSHVFKMGSHSATDADDWLSVMIAELPYGYTYSRAQNWIVEYETDRPVCGPLRVAALLKGVNGGNWHYLLEYIDHEGQMRERVFVAGLPIKDVAPGLRNDGLAIYGSNAAVDRLIKLARPKQFGTVLLQPGHARLGDGTAVYADKTGAVLTAQPAKPSPVRAVGFGAERKVAGTLQSWQAEVASLAVGNPLLTFALSAAVAGPLLDLANAAPIGLNFYGATSSGKSTALRLMASVYGDPVRLDTWNATQTAIELMAHQSNGGVLIVTSFRASPSVGTLLP